MIDGSLLLQPNCPHIPRLPLDRRGKAADVWLAQHQILRRTKPQPKEVIVDQLLQIAQQPWLLVEVGRCQYPPNEIVDIAVGVGARVPTLQVRADIPGRPIQVEVGESRIEPVSERDQVEIACYLPALVEGRQVKHVHPQLNADFLEIFGDAVERRLQSLRPASLNDHRELERDTAGTLADAVAI